VRPVSLFSACLAGLLLTGCQGGSPDGVLSPQIERLGLNTAAPAPVPTRADAGENHAGAARPTIVQGRSVLPAVTADSLALSDTPGLRLSFAEAGLKDVVDAILGDVLGLSYVVDPAVQGRVTIQSGRELSPREAVTLLESLLRLNGAALVRDDGILRVVPMDRVAGAAPPVAGAQAVGRAVTVLPLRHITAATAASLVRPVHGPDSVAVAEGGVNLLLAVGGSAERQAIAQLVRSVDQDWMAGRSVGLFPLEQATPAAVVSELGTIFAAGGQDADTLRLLPVERMNAVMAVTGDAARLAQIGDWVRRLDRGEADSRRLRVFPLDHARADTIAEMLGGLFGGAGTTVPAVVPPDRMSGEVGMEREPSALSGGADGGGGRLAGSGLDGGAAAADRLAALTGGAGGAFTSQAASRPLPAGGPRIIADAANNAVMVHALPGEMTLIEQAIRRLDVAPAQVLIEATIAEVTLNDALRYGVQSFLRTDDGEWSGGFTLNEATSALNPVTRVPGFNLIFSRNGDPRAILTALDEVTDVRVVSSPQVVVLDRQEAVLQVGDRVPVLTRTAQSVTDPDAPLVSSVEYVDTGVILKVLPRINQAGGVAMEVYQEISNVSGSRNSGNLTPTISQRQIRSNVAVRSGQTVVLGGLISDEQQSGRSGVPILSSIPAVGALFSQRTNSAARTELIVFITPRIIRSSEEAQKVTEELMARLRGLAPGR